LHRPSRRDTFASGGNRRKGTFIRSEAELLALWQGGDAAARDEVIASVVKDLAAIARVRLRQEGSATLETGELVNEAVERLMRLDRMRWRNRAHVIAMAARIMRRLLVDRARRRLAGKRDHRRVTLVTGLAGETPRTIDVLALEEALDALDDERARLVEMRFFGNMTIEEVAEAMDISPATVKRRWAATRAWLQEALVEPPRS